MASNIISKSTRVLFENDTLAKSQLIEDLKEKSKYVRHIVWINVIILPLQHFGALYGLYLSFTSAKFVTTLFAILLYSFSVFGITAGAHRLWAHRSYKAKWPLQLLLMIMNTAAFQNAAIDWSREHRIHHKYSETDADPHNIKRGFFFAHMGWKLINQHPDVMKKSKSVDLSDLERNSILAFQKKYYVILRLLLCFVLPTVIPVVFWDETVTNAFFISTVLRYIVTLHVTGLVNSAAHMFGNKPYDRYIGSVENTGIAIAAFGEGWHNYHHVFPWDYKTDELGNYRFNVTTAFIDFFAKIGWAYDLKTTSKEIVRKRVAKTGDGSHEIWGWGDKDQTQEERDAVIVTHHHTKEQ